MTHTHYTRIRYDTMQDFNGAVEKLTRPTHGLKTDKARMRVVAAPPYRVPKSVGAQDDFGHFRLSQQAGSKPMLRLTDKV